MTVTFLVDLKVEALPPLAGTTTSITVSGFYECLLQANEYLVADSDCDEPVAVWLFASET